LGVVYLLTVVLPLAMGGCMMGPGATGSFDSTFSAQGPVHLELRNGSGAAVIRTGDVGQIRIHGDMRVHSWLFGDSHAGLDDLRENPPVRQDGNTIRIGDDRERLRMVSVDYVISVPPDTDLTASIGSGSLDVRGIQGPLQATTGSGHITAAHIHESVQLTSGSGSIRVEDVGGPIHLLTGSGSLDLAEAHNDVRASTGSGTIRLEDAPGRLSLHTGSGSIRVTGASGDLRAVAGSGHLVIDGNPASNSYWELETSSGGVDLRVPSSASFRLYAHTSSGRISTDLPVAIEEQSRRELRARLGAGAARVDVRCSSGGIRIE
jgi:DUF4097 and DUF4098 domain-containing protein YvlB